MAIYHQPTMSLSINDLKKGVILMEGGDPYLVLSVNHLHLGRGGAVVQTKLRNLRSGKVFDRNFKPGEAIKEAEIEKLQAKFSHQKQNTYWFHQLDNPANRFSLSQEILGEKALFLKAGMEVTALWLIKGREKEIISIELPIKADYRVIEAPPAIRGNTAQGGSKTVVLETGARISTPLFIETGDLIRVNTETGEYAERIEKA
jgi:elongation factor P